ncbi:AraC family transcriptional regulator [Antarcticimicrobium sediminis]|nr:AraC family transcriptional regulator [Antarcticimicrobium sediminis]
MLQDLLVPTPTPAPLQALRSQRLFSSADMDETRELISRILQPHEMTPLGGARRQPAHMDYIDLSDTCIGALHFGAAQIEVEQIEDFHLVIFCIAGSATATCERREYKMSRTSAFICNPGQSFSARFSPDCEQIVVKIDRGFLRSHSHSHSDGRTATLPNQLDLRAPRLRSWLSSLDTLANDPALLEMLRESPRLAADYKAVLANLLLTGAGTARTGAAGASSGPVPATLRRAESYVAAHARDPICLEDIAMAAGVPVRTLLHVFRQFRATSPMQYVKQQRLQIVRARLSAPSPDDTVSRIAFESGFTHLSRFAADYAAHFGEKPSETLQRRA